MRKLFLSFLMLLSLGIVGVAQIPNFPTSLDTQSSLLQGANNKFTRLVGFHSSGATTLIVQSTAGFPSSGILTINGGEIVRYTGKTSSPTASFTGVIRGYEGTTAVSHASLVSVESRITFGFHDVHSLAIIGIQTKLGIGSDTPATGEFLKGTSSGVSAWSALTSGEVTTALGFTPLSGSRLVNTTAPLTGGGNLTGDLTLAITDASASVSGAVNITTQSFNGVKTLLSPPTFVSNVSADGAQGNTSTVTLFKGSDSSSGSPISTPSLTVGNPSTFLQTFRTGGSNGWPTFGWLYNFNLVGTSYTDVYGHYLIGNFNQSLASAPSGSYSYELARIYGRFNPSNVTSGRNLHMYSLDVQAERLVTDVAIAALYLETRNSADIDASISTTDINRTYKLVTSTSFTSPAVGAHGTGIIFSEGVSNRVSDYFGWRIAAEALSGIGLDFSDMSFTLQGTTWAANSGTNTLTISSGGHAAVEAFAGDWLKTSTGVWVKVASATANTITMTGTYASFGGSTSSNLTLTKPVQPLWLRNQSFISGYDSTNTTRYRLIGLDKDDKVAIAPDGQYATVGTNLIANNNFTNKATIGAASGQETYPGIWFGSATPTLANAAFLADVASGITILNGSNEVDFRVGNVGAWLINSSKHLTPWDDNVENIGDASHRPATVYVGTNILVNTSQVNAGSPFEAVGSGPSIFQRTIAGANSSPQAAFHVRLKHTSGAAAAGGGPSVLYYYEDSAGNAELAGRTSALWEVNTDGSEAGKFTIGLRSSADSTASIARFTVNSTGISNPYYGADVASATTITPTGNSFTVTGSTTITTISATNINAGTILTLKFSSTAQLSDGSNLKLNGNFTGSADRVITLFYDGTNFYEMSRSAN